MARQCDHRDCGKCKSCGACGYQTSHYPSCKLHGYDMASGAPTGSLNQPVKEEGRTLVALTKEQADEQFGKPHILKTELKIIRFLEAKAKDVAARSGSAGENSLLFTHIADEVKMLAHDIAMGRHNE